jgi:hypothetical protein
MNQEITNVLKAYEKALNTSDAKAALALYGSDPDRNAPKHARLHWPRGGANDL